MSSRSVSSVLLAAVLGVTGAGVASADIGDNRPSGADATVWTNYVAGYREEADWSPQGTVVADSGFRAYSDGFSFFNTGMPDSFNNAMFGTAIGGPKNLDAPTMRDLMGKRVCVERQDLGPCTLTLAAKQWMASANESMAGGHCLGFASTAAEIFSNLLQPAQFQPGVSRTYDLGLQTPISRQIARNMASQYAMNIMDYRMSPKKTIDLLKASLKPGSMPYTLFILWPAGGHALTPYAVFDRGNGQYDIGVYDNNYPDADRAIRVDTVKNTYRYLVQTNPNGEPEIAQDVIGLVPTDVIAATQSCPFCPAANDTTVQLTPVRSRVAIKTRITDLDGKKIKGVVVNRPTNPWEPGQKWEFPTYTVPKKQEFIVTIDARASRKPVRTNVLAVTGQFTIGTQGATIPRGGVGAVGLVPDKGLIVYGSNGKGGDLGALSFVDTAPTTEVQVAAATASKGGPFLLGRLNEKSKQVVLFTPGGKPGEAVADAYLQHSNGSAIASVQAELPRKGRLVIDYAKWSANRPRAIRAYVRAPGRTIPVDVEVNAN